MTHVQLVGWPEPLSIGSDAMFGFRLPNPLIASKIFHNHTQLLKCILLHIITANASLKNLPLLWQQYLLYDIQSVRTSVLLICLVGCLFSRILWHFCSAPTWMTMQETIFLVKKYGNMSNWAYHALKWNYCTVNIMYFFLWIYAYIVIFRWIYAR